MIQNKYFYEITTRTILTKNIQLLVILRVRCNKMEAAAMTFIKQHERSEQRYNASAFNGFIKP